MKTQTVLSLAALPIVVIGLAGLMPASALASPPPPPGGHIPIFFGGANEAGYPPLTPTQVAAPAPGALPPDLAATTAPNPFRARTTIRFALHRPERTRIRFFNLAGEEIAALVHSPREAGWQEVEWDGRNVQGQRLASGVYFYRIEAGGRAASGRLVFLR